MKLDRTRSVSLRTVALVLVLCSALVPPVSTAQSSPQVDNPSVSPSSTPVDFLPPKDDQLPAIPMPQDRSADSYRIYSVLLPVGQLAAPGWPRSLWLLSDTTLALVPTNESCLPREADGTNMNPHLAIEAPAGQEHDFAELLEDFDRRCHERIQLTPEAFNLVVPLRLLSQNEQDEFIRKRFDPNAGNDADVLIAHYRGAPGLSRFSQVYFNSHHTVAMVYATGWCGGLCAQSYWQVLGLEDGQWKRLDWHSAVVLN